MDVGCPRKTGNKVFAWATRKTERAFLETQKAVQEKIVSGGVEGVGGESGV